MCPQCFEINPISATFCQLCGAALTSGKEAGEGSDTEVYRELAQTNLFRMRGSYKEAIASCLMILKKYPNNATAHTLLGDIHAEMGELPQAVEWYEMALDLNPKSEADKKKLDSVKKRIHEREQAQTAEQIGLTQSTRPSPALYIGGMAAAILVVGAVSFYIGGALKGPAPKAAVNKTIGITEPTATQPKEDAPDSSETPAPSTQDPAPSAPAPKVMVGGPDNATLEFLRAKGMSSASVVNVSEDPRSGLILVTAEAEASTAPKALAALIANDVFTVLTSPTKAVIRIVQQSSPLLVVDAEKAAWETAKGGLTEGQTIADAADSFLTNPWPSGQ
jgi:hypothetical protein